MDRARSTELNQKCNTSAAAGFELALRMPDRIRSLTVLNTTSALSPVPYPGELFARVAGRMPGPMIRPDVWRLMVRRVDVADEQALSDAALDAWR